MVSFMPQISMMATMPPLGGPSTTQTGRRGSATRPAPLSATGMRRSRPLRTTATSGSARVSSFFTVILSSSTFARRWVRAKLAFALIANGRPSDASVTSARSPPQAVAPAAVATSANPVKVRSAEREALRRRGRGKAVIARAG